MRIVQININVFNNKDEELKQLAHTRQPNIITVHGTHNYIQDNKSIPNYTPTALIEKEEDSSLTVSTT